jgi:hypothetical protein
MFAVGDAAQTTSLVERVVLHVRVTSVLLDPTNAWKDVTNVVLNPAPSAPAVPRTKTKKGLG